MTPEELSKLARLMMQPTTSAAAFASLSFGIASQAMGIWTGLATGALQASQRLFAPGGSQPRQPPAPAEPQQSGAPAVLSGLEGGAAQTAPQPVEPAAATAAAQQEVGPQNGSPAKAPAKAIQNAANSAAALGDPEAGKDFARKAEAKTARSTPSEKQKPQAAERAKAEARATAPTAPAPRQPKAADRPESPDNLKAVSGIGPKLEKVLNGLGIWTYAELAHLTGSEIAWLEDHLGFGGRIGRDDWVGQAKALAPTKR